MTAALDDNTAAVFAACHDSPSVFARRFLDLSPTKQQTEFLDAVARPGARAAVRSGHGTGKSTALAVAALWFLSTRADALVPCTAPTAHQLQDVLWREIRRLVAGMPKPVKALFTVSQDRVTLAGSTGMIVARTARPENPDALQGFHAAEILFVIDEAAGVGDAVFEVARGALSTPSARVAMAANPTRLSGYFYEAFHKNRDNWRGLCFSCLDSPLVAPEYPAEMAREFGEDSDVYRVRVLGEFPRHGLNSLISADNVVRALNRTLGLGAARYAPSILGVDPAWEGNDRSVIVHRKGVFAEVLTVLRRQDGVALAQLVAQHRTKLGGDTAIFVDQTGVGASVCDQLRHIGVDHVRIAFNQTPANPERFQDKRVEMWWAVREWLQGDVALSPHDEWLADLTAPEYETNPRGKLVLESKAQMRKRGLASPDLGDALALTFAMPVFRCSVKQREAEAWDPYRVLRKRN